MPTTFSYDFKTEVYTKKLEFPTGVFINNEFTEGGSKTTIDVIDPRTGQVITQVDEATPADVERAVAAARKAFETTWGLNCPGVERGKLLYKLAEKMEEHFDDLAAVESLDNGKTFSWAKNADLNAAISCIRYYAGWADKNHGQTIETSEAKLAYTRHEPKGVCGQIIAWNFPLMLMAWKLGPALATGCSVVLKPSEWTPLTALMMASYIKEVGFPPGVVNILIGYGHTVGQRIAEHPDIDKISFTGSTLVGRKIQEAAAKSNLKDVTLELGGKSPNIVFDDADLEQAVSWSSHGIFWNHGQACCAGSRIFVQAGIYDRFLEEFTKKAAAIKLGDPFERDAYQGPQVSQIQYDRIMDYIASGKSQGATVHLGGERHGTEGFWIQPTIFTDTKPDMRIVREEIFGPVGVVIKFTDEEDVIRQANDTEYGLASAVFSRDIDRALKVAHRLQAGTAWVNCVNTLNASIPFGGFKQSGIGRELGEYALHSYTNVKAVHVNLGLKM
ncbi:aldehyde dehydrogenase domain-containing protein [Vararia minispora EC-137]|uniref:Aldehyde dehydrogenase domain-containing protein n=1 Tax=Vararia minispora EC-137 TaxID=1314806 RepID=A0ACB8QP46_9AGAM|nr:aldehyde dehydrogenase domain-containing protein [Vararia minispora EC-137]